MYLILGKNRSKAFLFLFQMQFHFVVTTTKMLLFYKTSIIHTLLLFTIVINKRSVADNNGNNDNIGNTGNKNNIGNIGNIDNNTTEAAKSSNRDKRICKFVLFYKLKFFERSVLYDVTHFSLITDPDRPS